MDEKMCSKCCKISPIRDHMNAKSTAVFKLCVGCRRASRARSVIRRERKKARLEAFSALQLHTPQLARYIYGTSSYVPIPHMRTSLKQEAGSSNLDSETIGLTSAQTEGTTMAASSDGSSHSSQSSDGDAESDRPPTCAYFQCIHCDVYRSVTLRYDDVCVYCLQHPQKWCFKGNHEADEPDFKTKEDGGYAIACNKCWDGKVDTREKKEESSDDSDSSASSEQ